MTARSSAAVRVGQGAARTAATPAAPGDPVEALRRRLAGKTAREHVVLDFLADDLREARSALAVLEGYVGRIEAVLGDAEVTQAKLLSLALGGGPVEQIDYLAEVLANVRRRVAQVAARM
ncbi:MAG TPA: hypothetical protein VFP50_00505 [Anaeromyxobacteraceae bacterium]|nr:hypothetical protein [Anaeromyxobacteraceae bacterium]